MLQHSRLPAQLTRSCMSSGRRCLTCDTANPFLKAFCSSCTLSFRCFCELEHACSAQWWIRVITYGCTKVLLTLTLKISDCSSIALNQDPQAFSHAQANLGTGTPYCSPPLLGIESRLETLPGTARSTAASGVLICPRKICNPHKWDTWKQIVIFDKVQGVHLVNPVLEGRSGCRWELHKGNAPARNLHPGTTVCVVCNSAGALGDRVLLAQPSSHARVGVICMCST